jgi:hypothetical protein
MKSRLLLIQTILVLICLQACHTVSENENFVAINCAESIVDEYVLCSCELPGTFVEIQAKVKKRGSSSRIYPKQSYTLQLEAPISFCNMPASNDWILNAGYIDKTLMRNRLSYELFTMMSSDNFAPAICYQQLQLNDEEQGIYLLTQKVTATFCGLMIGDTAAVLFKEPTVFQSKGDSLLEESRPHEGQIFPKPKKMLRVEVIDRMRNWLFNSSETEFNAKVGELFDLNNLADWVILLYFTNNNDGLFRNFYLYRQQSESPFRICIWDYDESFGRTGDGRLTAPDELPDFSNHILISRLLQNETFKFTIKSRWQMHRKNLLYEDKINALITLYQQELKPMLAQNSGLWPTSGPGFKDAANFEEEVNLIRSFTARQLVLLDAHFMKL